MSEFKIEKKWIYAIALILIVSFVMGFWTFRIGREPVEAQVWTLDGVTYTDWWAYVAAYQTKYGEPPKELPPDGAPRDAAKLQVNLQNAINRGTVSGSNTDIDITAVRDGVVNFLEKEEEITSATPMISALFYAEGDTLIYHVLSDTNPTGGEDYYDTWYWFTVTEGADIYKFTPACVSVRSKSPTYTYNFLGGGETTGYKVKYTAGQTPYWDLGVMFLYPRVNKTNLDLSVTCKGIVLSSVADGATWDDTDAEVNANHTMTGTLENIYVKLLSNVADLSYGIPQYTLSQNGELQTRKAVVIFATTMTAIGSGELIDEGWKPISRGDLYANTAYYKVIDPIIPDRGDTFEVDIKLPIDSSAAASSTEFLFSYYIHDMQMETYVAAGSPSTSIPTAYGFLNQFGIASVVHGTATLTVTSGQAETEHMMHYLTTA